MTDTKVDHRRPQTRLQPFWENAAYVDARATPEDDAQIKAEMAEIAGKDWSVVTGWRPFEDHEGTVDHQDFWETREHLHQIKNFMNAHATSEWAGLGAALEVVAQTIPPWVVLPDHIGDHGSLNGITGLCADSGGGKSIAQKLGLRVLGRLDPPVSPRVIGTGEGIPKLYGDYVTVDKHKSLQYESMSALQTAGDVDSLYAQMNRSGATLLGALLSAWDGSDLGAAIAGKDNRVPLGQHRYRWGLITGIQLLRSQVLLDSEASGLMQRVLLWPTDFTERVDRTREKPAPLNFKPPQCWTPFDRNDDGSYDIFAQSMGEQLPESDMLVISVPQKVIKESDEFDLKKRRGKFPDPLDHHLNHIRLKLAARFMWLDGRVEMNEEDWYLAGYVIEHVHKPTRERLRKGAEDSRRSAIRQRESDRALVKTSTDVYAARVGKLANHLYEKVGDREMTYGQLKRGVNRPERDDAIELLVSSGKWVKEPTRSNRAGWRYRRSEPTRPKVDS